MAENNLDESNIWMFPTIDVLSQESEALVASESEEVVEEATIEEPIEVEPISEKELEQDKLFTEKLTQLENLKKDFLNKVDILNKIFDELKSSSISIDEEMINLIDQVVKKAVKKIILKEMGADSTILPNMIGKLKNLIQEKNSVLTIYISQDDHQIIMQENLLPDELLSVNPDLTQGDIIVKSHFSEISAILDERIEAITKVDHDGNG